MDDLIVINQDKIKVICATQMYRIRNVRAGLSNPESKTSGPDMLGVSLGTVLCLYAHWHFAALCAKKIDKFIGHSDATCSHSVSDRFIEFLG